MALNIRQIAQIAGVSASTVSRATNPETRHKVAPETLKKIERLVGKHGYVPNIAARQLNRPGVRTIGILLPYHQGVFYQSYYTHLLAGIADALMETEYRFKLILLKPRKEKWNWYDFQAGEGVEGIIVTHWFEFFSPSFLNESKIPCVVINDPDESVKAFFVSEDGVSGGRLAAEHFFDKGHRRVAMITGASHSQDSNLRMKGFVSFWRERGLALPHENIIEGDFAGGRKTELAVERLLELDPRPSAVFCANDTIALTALRIMSMKGARCPDDISLLGYDDSAPAGLSLPPLSTIQVPLYDIARRAVDVLLEFLLHGDTGTEKFCGLSTVTVKLVERESVRELDKPS